MTHDEIISLAKGHLGVTSSVTTHDQYLSDVLNDVIYKRVRNECIRLQESYLQVPYIQGLIVEQNLYDVKNTGGSVVPFQKIISVKVRFTVEAQEWFGIRYQPGLVDEEEQTVSTGFTIPTTYLIEANQIKFPMMPSENRPNSLRILAIPKVVALSSSDEAVDVPDEYHYILPEGLAMYLAERTGDDDKAARFKARYNVGIKEMQLSLKKRSRQPVQIEDAGYLEDTY